MQSRNSTIVWYLRLSTLAAVAGTIVPLTAAKAATVPAPSASPQPAASAPATNPASVVTAVGAACAAPEANGDTSIRPFKFQASDEELADLKRRIAMTRFPERELVSDPSQGVQLATIQKLARYWAQDYDWRKFEARLNALPQFVTRIDGVDIHFIHVKSKEANALPLIITHGWPGSIVEELKVIDPLTNPTAHGGKPSDAFDVVIPSLPGFGFSGKPANLGWNPQRIARAEVELMKRLGYDRFVASGGDWGAPITEEMALQAPSNLIAMHTNLPFAMPAEIATSVHSGYPAPADLGPDERHAYGQLEYFYNHGLGYAVEMGNRPQTFYGIEDSPIGLAAWILDHDIKSYELITRVFDGGSEGLTRDDVLDNITLYWLTKTAVSSARIYWENKLPFFVPLGVKIPVAVSAFADEIYQSPRSWAERAYPNLIFYQRHEGGHFASWEQPRAFVQDLRTAFGSLR